MIPTTATMLELRHPLCSVHAPAPGSITPDWTALHRVHKRAVPLGVQGEGALLAGDDHKLDLAGPGVVGPLVVDRLLDLYGAGPGPAKHTPPTDPPAHRTANLALVQNM